MTETAGKAATVPINPTGHPAPSPACSNPSNVDTSFQARLKDKQKQKKTRTQRSERPEITAPRALLPFAELQKLWPHIREGKTNIIRCGVQPGFMIQITSKGYRSYGVEAMVKGLGKQRPVIIGPVAGGTGVKFTVAQQTARKLHTDATVHGIDIAKATQRKLREKDYLELQDAHQQYIDFPHSPPMSEGSKIQYKCRIKHLTATLPKGNMWDYKKADVKSAYAKVVERSAQGKRAQVKTNVNAPGVANAFLVMTYLETLWNFHNRSRDEEDVRECPVKKALKGKNAPMQRPKKRDVDIEANRFAQWWKTLELISLGNALEATIAVWVLYFRMLVLTGCRRTELLDLKWSDIDLNPKTPQIFIPAARTKTKVDHRFPIGPWLTKQLRAHKKAQVEGTEWVFAYPEGTYCAGLKLSKAAATRVLNKHRKLLGWKWNAHDTRRTHATASVAAGVDWLVAAKLLNQVVPGQTARYAQIKVEHMRPAQCAIEAEMLKLAKAK